VFVGGGGNDTFIIPAANTVNAGDKFDGGAGNDTIQIGAGSANVSIDLSAAAFNNMEGIAVTNPSGFSSALLRSTQFGAGKISNWVVITGGGGNGILGNDILAVGMAAGGSLNLSGWTFVNWDGSDRVDITGSTGNETIVGGSEDDTFVVDNSDEV